MKTIEDLARRVLKNVDVDVCTTEDACPDSTTEFETPDGSLVIGDDNHRQQWSCDFRLKGNTQEDDLIEEFGDPIRTFDRGDGARVLNWEIDGVLMVYGSGELELMKDYKKV